VKTLYVTPVGTVAYWILDSIENAASGWFPFPVRRLPPLPLAESACDAGRGQYMSVEIMKALARILPPDTARLLGVTEVDLAIPVLSFLFGQAQLDGPIALISLRRLRQEFYHLPANEALLRDRAVKEAFHELGHTFGLTHCRDAACVMSLATHIGLVDAKKSRYCASCGMHVARRLVDENGERK